MSYFRKDSKMNCIKSICIAIIIIDTLVNNDKEPHE